MKAAKSAYDGIYFYDQADNVKVRKVIVSDNKYGLGVSAANDDKVNVKIDIEDSLIVG